LRKGQILVIFGVALLVLLVFVGLAIDAGSLYVTYGQLKRSVDAAAIAAANTFKRGEDIQNMSISAIEMIRLHNVDTSQVDLVVCRCVSGGVECRHSASGEPFSVYDGSGDTVKEKCENISPLPKMVWVRATQRAPLYFLGLLGFDSVRLTTDTYAEAAAVDLVLVLDVSESMAVNSDGYLVNDYDPTTCNLLTQSIPPRDANGQPIASSPPAGACLPMWYAKVAADALVSRMYEGYDRIAIITYADQARLVQGFTSDLNQARQAIWQGINVHDEAPSARLWPLWYNGGLLDRVNPVNPEDRDGDGLDDDDDEALYGVSCPWLTNPLVLSDRWWGVDEGAPDPFGWGGVPCDDDNLRDAYDWDQDDVFTLADHQASVNYLAQPNHSSLTFLSTCIGCGLREASRVFRENGRPGAVWVAVLFTDGIVNLSDVPGYALSASNRLEALAEDYPNGFCDGVLANRDDNKGWWQRLCLDRDVTPRYCIDESPSTCPPGSQWIRNNNAPDLNRNQKYSVQDYAFRMADLLAYTGASDLERCTNEGYTQSQIESGACPYFNPDEPKGNSVAVYSVGLLNMLPDSLVDVGESLLRYVANLGDDGSRFVDNPCQGKPRRTNCGNYYYAGSPQNLRAIFEDIASRIYTRLNQ